MHHTRNLAYVLLIISVVVLPTVAMLSWYQLTRDPNLRPLGITREALRAYGDPGAGVDMVAYIDWPTSGYSPNARQRFASEILASFKAKNVEARLEFRDHDGAPRVTYVVGTSIIGPFSASRAGKGVSAAVDAYRMH